MYSRVMARHGLDWLRERVDVAGCWSRDRNNGCEDGIEKESIGYGDQQESVADELAIYSFLEVR